jgi:GNAT superfamily N-acetyltransferase
MLEEVNKDIPIVKACTPQELIGYTMAQTVQFNRKIPLTSAIIDRFPFMKFEGRNLFDAAVFIGGPMCIAKEWRGQGVSERMFKKMLSAVRNRFDIGVTVIANCNLRSLAVAQNKLGMQVVNHLSFKGMDYSVLAFLTKDK